MNTMLVGYWIRRFALVFAAVAVALVALQVPRDGLDAIDFGGTVLWSVIPAVLAASINTWWVRRHGCRVR